MTSSPGISLRKRSTIAAETLRLVGEDARVDVQQLHFTHLRI